MSETEIKAIKARRRADNLQRKLELQKLGYVPKSRTASGKAPVEPGPTPQPKGESMDEIELKIAKQDAKIDQILDVVKDLKGERLANDVTDIKAGVATLLGHNQSFPLGQILGTLQTTKGANDQIVISQPQLQPQTPAMIQAPLPTPPALPTPTPATASPMQKMLSEMNARMDEMGKKLD